MSRRWLDDRRKDAYYRKAKERGYRSRAAFKLKQMNDRFHLLGKGDAVVDLGASPGGWLQVAKEIVGPSGKVVGVDLQSITDIEGVITIRGDMREDSTVEELISAVGKEVDVVLSDMSPDISGNYSMDHARSVHLVEISLEVASKILKEGGNLVAKVFQGDMLDPLLNDIRSAFESVKMHSPEASRSSSSEIYIIARSFRGTGDCT